ncbi:NASP-related protein sim3 [Heracleum sosnowskyi]|uniref:NASP-related protein sim3 n=1 Tax=Heracleum sosnowskyi TaxID=360622 RepID=A0AAD8M8Q9_9APIA|nr:NASP-related protein sim3 [Heracleum sosnowskyi]
MADEITKSETLAPSNPESASVDATIESNPVGGTESTCNTTKHPTGESSDPENLNSLKHADELMEKGALASKDRDYAEASDCYSRALEIRASVYGELAPECVDAYFKYGRALLYKAQDEADILGDVPKKEEKSQVNSDKGGSLKSVKSGESSSASVVVDTNKNGSSTQQSEVVNDGDAGKDECEDDSGSDTEDLGEADEDESDLDLAWKMLDIARAIVEKDSADTMEKVEILSALAEVALEREDIEASISDYLKALSMLERLAEPDSRHIASLNFRICLCLEIGSKTQEAIPYCEKAISVCKSRIQRLTKEAQKPSASDSPVSNQSVEISSSVPGESAADKVEEIETLNGLLGDLERKLEDMQLLASNPTEPVLPDLMAMFAAKAKEMQKGASSAGIGSSQFGTTTSGNLDSPTISTAQTNGAAEVTHLGVVGRGVKRVVMHSESTDSSPMKKPALDPAADKAENKTS